MTDTSYWTAIGMLDLRVVRFLAVCESSRAVVAVVRCPGDTHVVAVIPFVCLVRIGSAGRMTPWSLDEVIESSVAHLDCDRHLLAG